MSRGESVIVYAFAGRGSQGGQVRALGLSLRAALVLTKNKSHTPSYSARRKLI